MMSLYGNLIVYSTDIFSEHCCQSRTFLPPSISMATFPVKAFRETIVVKKMALKTIMKRLDAR
jgi:flavorubredoxin